MRIAVYQMNSLIGDLEGNYRKILAAYQRGVQENADLAIVPELALLGYPPQDLVEKKEFRDKVKTYCEKLARQTGECGLLFGSITEDFDDVGTDIFNSAILCYNGKVQFVQNKTLIPNYDVFDERRYFESSKQVCLHEFKGRRLGISICEDIWNDKDYWNKRLYSKDPVKKLIEQGADLLINISASPYAYGKREERRKMLEAVSQRSNVPLVYACCVGAQTDLIFDGGSLCLDKNGRTVMLGKTYEEDFFIYNDSKEYKEIEHVEKCFEEEALNALILGVKDYSRKTGFKKALLGLSGGIDSALVAFIAVKAMGPENVKVIMMPSQYSSKGSVADSEKLISNLGISYNTVPIQNVFESVKSSLKNVFNGAPEDLAEENMQSRIRGLFLMAMSNKFNYMLLTTGNKSEIAVGYATLYGDMCGALAVIGDLYKTEVYKISNYINREKEIIPIEIIEKAPSAELRPDQTDQDSLPPYDVLDKILEMYLEENKEYEEIVSIIGDSAVVKKTLRLVDYNEFKRKQAAPVLRISMKAFGYGRRFPIVHGWRKNHEN
ncbi:MAG TPA: NAD+ synthase [Ignavibacteriales bacterium]|nr:NAD+ synthase [Ignavibacteriales bacterium]